MFPRAVLAVVVAFMGIFLLLASTPRVALGDDKAKAKSAEPDYPKEIAPKLFTLQGKDLELKTVLQELAKGLANKQIADALAITEYTAKDHLKSIMAKLQVADRTEAVTAALQRGIIHL